mgnify:FL=1
MDRVKEPGFYDDQRFTKLDLNSKTVAFELHRVADIVKHAYFEGGDAQKEDFASRLESLRKDILNHMVTSKGEKL